jgi:hypothetical protein
MSALNATKTLESCRFLNISLLIAGLRLGFSSSKLYRHGLSFYANGMRGETPESEGSLMLHSTRLVECAGFHLPL